MVTCLLVGLQKTAHKAVSYEKLKEIIQGPKENPALFLSHLMEALQKSTTLNPTSNEGLLFLNVRFISQCTPDSRHKLQKLEESPQTPQKDLLNIAFQVFNNWDEEVKLEKQKRDQAKYQMLAAVIQSSSGRKQSFRGKSSKPSPGPCLKFGKEGCWAKACLNIHPPPGPCPPCGKEGHWKVNCHNPSPGPLDQPDFNFLKILGLTPEN